MSFREKSAWACLVTTIVVYIPYFTYILSLYSRDALNATSILTAFLPAVIFQVVLNVAAHIAIAISSGKKQMIKDERDLAIESKSFRIAYYIVPSACVVAILFVMLFEADPTHMPIRHSLDLAFVSQFFLLCFVVAEVTRYVTQVVCYRRGG
jgi:hypothetical protein